MVGGQGYVAAMSDVEIRRSARRKRTVRAYREGDRTIVLMPAHLSRAEEERHVRSLVGRLEAREKRVRPSDDELLTRATELSRRWLGAQAVPASVRWVGNQNARWGSCTSTDRTIRLSDRLKGMPEFVVDYVLLHELAHLMEPNHSTRFWALVDVFPEAVRAKGFLEGVSWQQR
ncbi:MAG: metal-dependent hydrolase [Aeromicrobium sp.]|nr:metal-dependent hydrolase [Aeromicrobium sp.]